MKLYHVSAECYPAAKVGGLGDVVGALPKVQAKAGIDVSVVMPAYRTPWMEQTLSRVIHEGRVFFDRSEHTYRVVEYQGHGLGFRLLGIDVPGFTDRPGVYIDPSSGSPYWDERERFLAFQTAFLRWLCDTRDPEAEMVLHCHDHHAALIPFLVDHAADFAPLKGTPTILTLHNGEYHGDYDLSFAQRLPAFDPAVRGLLEWGGQFNSLACGIKCAWRVTTVSGGYLGELMDSSRGLEHLLRHERAKCHGIINGIDTSVWNPSKDPMIAQRYDRRAIRSGKLANKIALAQTFSLDPARPLVSFIGRLVREKGADLLPDLIRRAARNHLPANFIVLGTGEKWIQEVFESLRSECVGFVDTRIEYNERLSHLIYAGSDFLVMPSRVEPCGLNQMYAMRYGTIPIVRRTGGLRDTVPPIGPADFAGRGFGFDDYSVDDLYGALERALDFIRDPKRDLAKRSELMAIDFSWERSEREYWSIYRSLLGAAGSSNKE